jgi:DNA-binding response OmpR family regulator
MVLLVDDEPAIREALRRGLERAGWSVGTAATAPEAARAASAAPPGAIILDYRMPDDSGQFASGLELLGAFRASPRLAFTPVILLTGQFLSIEERAAAAEYGATVIYKPADLRTILAQLSRLCHIRDGASGAA